MKSALFKIVIALTFLSAPALATERATPFINYNDLSACVPVLDFPEPLTDCVGQDTFVFPDGHSIEAIRLPASSLFFVRDQLSESWTVYAE